MSLDDVPCLQFFFEQAGTENQEAQKSTCDFEGLMVSNRGYDKGNITGGCKKFDIWRGLNSYPWYLVVCTWFQKIGKNTASWSYL